ncbi:MAG: trans-4-hydroxy-L-proline dehydratase activase [Caulobacteraceae bacterium]
MCKGRIFNIQKYSIHDGPGIRSTVFFKGCPLSCIWCHNPESQSFKPEILFYGKRCIGCGKCLEACQYRAISLQDGVICYDRNRCTLCENCVKACYAKARETAGQSVDVGYVMAQLEKDRIFYEESGGGVTFSGGEPLSQLEFLIELLEQCRKKEIHTAIDTSGYAAPEVISRVGSLADLFLYDLKLIDDEKHKEYIGVSNKVIFENLELLSKLGKRIFIRIPLIPGINDDDENIKATAGIIHNTPGVSQVNLLPYHNMAADKYKRLDKPNCLMEIMVPSKEYVEEISRKYLSYGINAKIGG